MTIDAAGKITWTTASDEAGTTYPITVIVDDGNGGTAEESFNLTVNPAPTLDISDTDVDEDVPLSIDLSTYLIDESPTDTHTYEFVGDDHGAMLTSGGMFSFTPDETLGGTDVEFTVRVTDQGGLTSESTFTVTVNEVNAPPTVADILDQIVNQGDLLSLDVMASDSDLPADTLSYALVNPPTGMTIDDDTGAIEWDTNGVAAGIYDVEVSVSDGHEDGTVTTSFKVTVNVGPELDITDTSGNENELISFDLMTFVSDANLPNDTLSFQFTDSAGTTANISELGVFNWTPGEADGGTVFMFTVQVTDQNDLTAMSTFSITVIDTNEDPVIQQIEDDAINAGDSFSLQVMASDSDLPEDTLSFALGGNVPTGMTIDPQTGMISWQTADDEAPTTYAIEVTVSDGAGGSATEAFNVTVNAQPSLDIPDQMVD
ncbi:MAG: putative Ig domain-containing protein [Pirellulales bacterium]